MKTWILVTLFARGVETFIHLLQSFGTSTQSLHWRSNRFSLLTKNFLFSTILPDPLARLSDPLAGRPDS